MKFDKLKLLEYLLNKYWDEFHSTLDGEDLVPVREIIADIIIYKEDEDGQ